MFRYIHMTEQSINERIKNIQNAQIAARNAANIDYLAMMLDIELADNELTDSEEETINEQEVQQG